MQTIKVTQTASKKVLPDTAVFSVRLAGESKKHEDATAQLRTQADRCRALLQKAGVREEELTAGGASVRAVKQDGKRVYVAQTEWKVRLSAEDERVAPTADALDEGGLQWQQEFVLSDKSYRDELLTQAVQQAREAAERIAAAAGGHIAAFISAQYEAARGGVMLMRAVRTNDAPSLEPTEVSETVTCVWEMQ